MTQKQQLDAIEAGAISRLTLVELNEAVAVVDARRWEVLKEFGIDSDAFHEVSMAVYELRRLRALALARPADPTPEPEDD